MPLFRSPAHVPGSEKLGPTGQAILESFFPPEPSIPSPTMIVAPSIGAIGKMLNTPSPSISASPIGQAAKVTTPPGAGLANAIRQPIARKTADIDKVLGPPQHEVFKNLMTKDKISGAFGDYKATIAKLLGIDNP